MAKKRQLDFAKTKLKPGRPVGKRKNLTSTSFKSKKIMVHHKSLKETSEETIPDVLKKVKNCTGQSKVSSLNKLNILIHKQKNSLFLHLPQIFESVYKIVLELDDNVRNAGIQVFITLLTAANDLQIKSYMPLIVNTLHCAMTASNNRTKTCSLALLDCMLKEHPDFICNSMVILNDLLQMVIDHPRKLSHSKFMSIAPVADETVYSRTTYEVNILGYINAFLKIMLKDKIFHADEDRDEQEVYWDCKGPLNLEIFAGGGLKPVDIEKLNLDDLDLQDGSMMDDLQDIDVVQPFLDNILSELIKIFSQEIPSDSKSDDKIFPKETISNLNIVFQVLGHVSDWAELLSYDAKDNEIKKFLLKKVWNRFAFETGQIGNAALQFPDCVQLNLEVCYLCAKFLVQKEEDYETYNDEIFAYVKKILGGKNEKVMPQENKLKSLPTIIKILKIYFDMSNVPEVSDFLQYVLTQLCTLLKTSDSRPEKQVLISLFIKISLDPAYVFLAKSDAMKLWYAWLFKVLKEKAEKVDIKLLRTIKKIANRNYPCFDQILSSLDFSMIKSLLRNHRDAVRDTAIFLIYNMDDVSGDMLEYIARIILLDSSFPKQYAVRLIRFLMYRFLDKPKQLESEKWENKEFSSYNAAGYVDFTLFLLNIAFDSYNLNNEKLVNFETNTYTKALKPLEASHAFSIFPSLKWKEHSELFEVCAKVLKQLPEPHVNYTVMEVVKEILNNTTTLPMHCALAILKLHNFEITDKYHRLLMSDFTFSCLLTLSVLTHMPMEDEWYRWNVQELMESMDVSRMTAIQTVQLIDDGRFGKPEGVFVFHVLRILKFLTARQLLDAQDARSLVNTLDTLKSKCFDKSIAQQPLYIKLYRHFCMLYQTRQ